ncbi:MAG TPA: hypothetical protein VNW92_02220 [Polyangiaceae bacterium]|nr:hypothetical protein [Polyangiaceae bacterium]
MEAHSACRADIDAHFAGRGAPERERELRAHCSSCAECRGYYERHLLLSELDPAALGVRERLGRGLGLTSRPHFLRAAQVLVVAAAAAGCFAWLGPRHSALDSDFRARGAPSAPRAGLQIYRMGGDGGTEAAPRSIKASDELAFAYENAGGYPYLLVFGVDEHRHVYWYHPAWSDAATDPVAISVRSGPQVEELPEAVSQTLDGRSLQIVAVFTRSPLGVRAVERELAKIGNGALVSGLSGALDGALVVSQTLEVSP